MSPLLEAEDVARAWSLTGTKISQLETTLARLAEYEGWLTKKWPERFISTPLQTLLAQLLENLGVFTDIKELSTSLEKVEFTVGSWCDAVLIETYSLLFDLTDKCDLELNMASVTNIAAMVRSLSAFEGSELTSAMDFAETFPAIKQIKQLLASIERLEALRSATELSFEDGEFLHAEVAAWSMQEYWAQVAMKFQESSDDLKDFAQEFSERVRDRYYSADTQAALFAKLVKEQDLEAELRAVVDAMPESFVKLDVAAVSGQGWKALDLAALIQKAQVPMFYLSFSPHASLRKQNYVLVLLDLKIQP